VNNDTSKGSFASAKGECINVEKGLSLKGAIVRYSSVEGGIICLYSLTQFSFLLDLSKVFSSDSPNNLYIE